MRRMKKGVLLAQAAASALLFALGLPNELFPYGLPVLGYVALIPLYFALGDAPSYGFAAVTAGLYGALHHGLSSYWLYFFHGFAFWTLGSTVIAYFIVYAVWGLYLGYFVKKSGVWRPLAFAVFWAVFEYAKSTGFLGYPWGLLSYTQTRALPLLQIADMTGVYGITFFLAFANGALAELLLRHGGPVLAPRNDIPRPRALALPFALREAAAALLLVAVVAAYGWWRLAAPARQTGSITAEIVQQNADPWNMDEAEGVLKNIRLARAGLEASGRKPDIILFSESSLEVPFLIDQPWYERNPASDPFLPFVRQTGSYFLTGSPVILDPVKLEATNSVILISPEGRQVGEYAKVHPVPFAEAIPFWEIKPFREFIQKVVGLDSGWTMGTEFRNFSLPVGAKTYRFGAPICFEDAFPDVCRQFALKGADLFINLTNDSWSMTGSSEIQHFAAARFRAIEFRKTLVRSTNGGVSCVVEATGRARDELPLFKDASEVVDLPVYGGNPPTLYLLWGDWFAYSCMLLFAAWFLILWVGESGSRRRQS
jgi:apolipoprotein N-acyltransferase